MGPFFVNVRFLICLEWCIIGINSEHLTRSVTWDRASATKAMTNARVISRPLNLHFVNVLDSSGRFITARTGCNSIADRILRSLDDLTSRLITSFVTLDVVSLLRTVRVTRSRNRKGPIEWHLTVFHGTSTVASTNRLIYHTSTLRKARGVTITRRSDRRRNRHQRRRAY